MRHWTASLIVAVIVLAASPAVADQKDPRLDQLFVQLKSAASVETAGSIEAEIWDIWMQSGDDKVDALMAIGVGRLNEDNYDRALDAFDQMVRLGPEFAEGCNKRATTLYLMGRFADSVRDIERVLALEPRHFGALSGLGLCNVQLHKDQEALRALEKAARVDPNMPGLKLRIDELKQRLAEESI
jgi:tetratricopeptide (TPR) repeat protein